MRSYTHVLVYAVLCAARAGVSSPDQNPSLVPQHRPNLNQSWTSTGTLSKLLPALAFVDVLDIEVIRPVALFVWRSRLEPTPRARKRARNASGTIEAPFAARFQPVHACTRSPCRPAQPASLAHEDISKNKLILGMRPFLHYDHVTALTISAQMSSIHFLDDYRIHSRSSPALERDFHASAVAASLLSRPGVVVMLGVACQDAIGAVRSECFQSATMDAYRFAALAGIHCAHGYRTRHSPRRPAPRPPRTRTARPPLN
ncbi:hypothetical protein EXIGLDRAFT_847588, partial [Exidia glandulosa HHB12029]